MHSARWSLLKRPSESLEGREGSAHEPNFIGLRRVTGGPIRHRCYANCVSSSPKLPITRRMFSFVHWYWPIIGRKSMSDINVRGQMKFFVFRTNHHSNLRTNGRYWKLSLLPLFERHLRIRFRWISIKVKTPHPTNVSCCPYLLLHLVLLRKRQKLLSDRRRRFDSPKRTR